MQTDNDANIVSFPVRPKSPSQRTIRLEGEKPMVSANSEIPDIHSTPIEPMMEFVADQLRVNQTVVEAFVTTAFFVERIDQLPVQDYQRAMSFLIELRCKAIGKPGRQSSH